MRQVIHDIVFPEAWIPVFFYKIIYSPGKLYGPGVKVPDIRRRMHDILEIQQRHIVTVNAGNIKAALIKGFYYVVSQVV